jgi:omega-amidase
MKIGIFQYRMKWEDKKSNKSKILKILDMSDLRGVDWIIFPEMSLSGFTTNIKIASLTDEDISFFVSLAKKYHINLSFGGVENKYNKFITLNRNGDRISEYSKINLFTPAREDKVYKKGKRVITFDMEGFSVTPFICFDLRFPENFMKVRLKTTLYVVIAAWPYSRIEHWTTLLRARSIENQSYVIGVNSIGEDNFGNEYKGYSCCYSPNGELVLDCQSREGRSIADINPETVFNTRENFKIIEI